jgi:UPF0271 protein
VPGKVHVLDTSAVIAGLVPGLADIEQVTIPEVLEEAHDLSSRLELETAVTAGKVRVAEPSGGALAKVEAKAGETGDRVSGTDIRLLALALDLLEANKNPELVTDDYAIQNLASLFGISYRKIAMPGITKVLKWRMKCPACGRIYPAPASRCEACGSSLVREPKG